MFQIGFVGSPPRTYTVADYFALTASLSSGCPHTASSGQISSSCELTTSRTVDTMNQSASSKAALIT